MQTWQWPPWSSIHLLCDRLRKTPHQPNHTIVFRTLSHQRTNTLSTTSVFLPSAVLVLTSSVRGRLNWFVVDEITTLLLTSDAAHVFYLASQFLKLNQLRVLVMVMAALRSRCGHNTFSPVVTFFYLSSFFYSSPNLSGRRLDVYHTSTHGVALVRI